MPPNPTQTGDSPKRRFPDHATYLAALRQAGQDEVFECLRAAVKQLADHDRLYAKTKHSSIGIPKGPVSKGQGDNSLCRVRTVDSYQAPTVLSRVELELVADA